MYPSTEVKFSETLLEANDLLFYEGFLYGEKSNYDQFVEHISETVDYMKKDG